MTTFGMIICICIIVPLFIKGYVEAKRNKLRSYKEN